MSPGAVEIGLFIDDKSDWEENGQDQHGIFQHISLWGFPGKGKKTNDASPNHERDGDEHQFGKVIPGHEIRPFEPAFEDLTDGCGELRHDFEGLPQPGDRILQRVRPEQDAEHPGEQDDQEDGNHFRPEASYAEFGSSVVMNCFSDNYKKQKVADEEESARPDADTKGNREDERQ